MKDVKYIADLLDTKFQLSNGWRFGWDGILGLIPGAGNLITDAFSLYIIFRSAVLGCSPSILLHMVLNVVIDNLVDKIPILGFFFDFFWKANTKNVRLLENYLKQPNASRKQSKLFLLLTGTLLISLFIVMIVTAILIVKWLITITL
jgi:hypothetical protein